MPVVGDVLVGEDGDLFLYGGAHRVFEYATGLISPQEASFANLMANLEKRRAYCAERGVAYQHVVFPDKQSCLLTQYEGSEIRSLGRVYTERLGPVFGFPLQAFRAKPRAFHLTDTHWNGLGQIRAMSAVLEGFGWPEAEREELAERLQGQIVSMGGFYGDLGKKLDPRRGEVRFRYNAPESVLIAMNNLDAGNDGFMKLAYNPEAPDRRLMICGDSFAQIAVEPLSAVFRTILFLRTRHFHPEVAEQMQPTHVLTSNVERYLAHVQSDEDRHSFFMMPLLKGRTVSADLQFAQVCNAMLSYGREPYRRVFG
jgi:hypothetical protein